MLRMSKLPSFFENRAALRVGEVARALGVSEETVAHWIRRGDLPAAKVGRTWLVSPDILRQRLMPGYPERLL
jgi:excisionase family DNA binding protein